MSSRKMECCFPIDGCEEYAVTPVLIAPCYPQKCVEDPPMCFPCLPACAKGKMMYCCEKSAPRAPMRTPVERDDYDDDHQGSRQSHSRNTRPPKDACPPQREHSCCDSSCKPVRTKYVIPCYRYEDGRIRNQPTVLTRRACEVAVGSRARRKPYVESSFRADPDKEITRYRSEDERPAVPMRHANEVADESRARRKPYVESRFRADADKEITRYRSEDERPAAPKHIAYQVSVESRAQRKPYVESSFRVEADKQITQYRSEDERGNCCFHYEMKDAQKCPNAMCPNSTPPQCVNCPECRYTDCVKARIIPSTNNSCCYYCN